MEDKDKDIFNDSQKDFSEEEERNYVENNKSESQSSQDVQEELGSEAQTDASQKEDSFEKGEALKTETYNSEETVQSDNITEYVWNSEGANESAKVNAEPTYHFKPDNMKEYVTKRQGEYSSPYGYSHSFEADSASGNKKSQGKGKNILIVALISVIVALSVALGCVIGYLARPSNTGSGENTNFSSGGNSEQVTIKKDDDPIEVMVTPADGDRTELTRMEVVELVADAVVEITTSTVQTNSFFGGSYVTSGAGSGVVITQTDNYAYIVTNYHVVEGASSIQITCTDKTVFEAEYLDGDANSDIAMLRIATDKDFPEVAIGSSSGLKIGQDILVIGNPLGKLGGTVTEGIVSALDRKITIDGVEMSLLQTSAAVNPGNSGGGMFNMAGQLVGIVNAKQSAEGIEGLGFAIPIDSVYDMLIEIIEHKYIKGRATLGIEVRYVTDPWVARIEYGVGGTGLFVTSSDNDKIISKDLLHSINGYLVTDPTSYSAALAELTVGETVSVVLYRNGRLTSVVVEVAEYVPSGMFG